MVLDQYVPVVGSGRGEVGYDGCGGEPGGGNQNLGLPQGGGEVVVLQQGGPPLLRNLALTDRFTDTLQKRDQGRDT